MSDADSAFMRFFREVRKREPRTSQAHKTARKCVRCRTHYPYETKRPGYTEACWGRQATEFATTTLLNQRVALIADASQDTHDRYGRTLAYIETVNGDFSVLAAAAGAGRSYVFDPSHPPQRAREIAAAEASARGAARGL